MVLEATKKMKEMSNNMERIAKAEFPQVATGPHHRLPQQRSMSWWATSGSSPHRRVRDVVDSELSWSRLRRHTA